MNKHFFQRKNCRLCASNNLEKVLSLTPTPLCDAYVTSERVGDVQEVYPLDLFLCRDCGYVHVPYVVDPEIIYPDYLYITTSSLGLSEHFCRYAEDVLRRVKPSQNALVVDIGSNDGTLLRAFKVLGLRVLGVEPAKKIAQDATRSGIETLPDFFTVELARSIKNKYGSATIITINNLFANIDDLEGMVKGLYELLAPNGVLVIESSYLVDLIQNMIFDFIYHEHLSYFSVKPLMTFLRRFGIEMIDIERVPTKGGSLRYFFQLVNGPRNISKRISELLTYENRLGLDRVEPFKAFGEKILRSKTQLNTVLLNLKSKNKTIAGYGGSATSTTLIYYFELGKVMDYIVDDNPTKQYTFSPGYHIPVLPSEVLYERRPDYVLLLAWRYAEPIIKEHTRFLNQDGHFVIPLPEVKII